MAEYKEPTKEQLVNFLLVYIPQMVGREDTVLLPEMIERMLDDPEYYQAAIGHHRRFIQEMHAQFEKMERGQLRCEHIRGNGRRCPNFNQAGSFYCGLHQPEE